MKKLSILLMLLMCSIGTADNYNVPLATVTPVIDGVISAGEYDDALMVDVSMRHLLNAPHDGHCRLCQLPQTEEDYSHDIYYKWDNDFLYVCIDTTDDSPQQGIGRNIPQVGFDYLQIGSAIGSGSFLQEAILWDFLLDGTILENGGTVYSSTGTHCLGTAPSATNYITEIAFAWDDFSAADPNIGDVHGQCFTLQDQDADPLPATSTSRQAVFQNMGGEAGPSTLVEPQTWGTLTLVTYADLACPDWGHYEGDLNIDCTVDEDDLVLFMTQWLECTDANIGAPCVDLR